MTALRCSLITPLKNERDNIETLWKEVFSQSVLPAEWIIADNGSTDGTFEWLTERSSQAPFPVTVLSLEGRTIAQMLNAAIRLAKQDVIACCHGGTRLPSDWLEELLKPLAADPGVDFSGGVCEAFGITAFERWVAGSMADSMRLDYQNIDEKHFIPASRSLAFRRAAWAKAGGFPEWLPKFGEDTLFGVRLYAAGRRFAMVRGVKVGWRPKSDPLSLLRQQRLYNEANGCMGICPSLDLRFLARAGTLLGASALATAARGPAAGLLASAALIAADFLRLKAKGYYKRLGAYLFWAWAAAAAKQLGLLIGSWWRLTGRVHVPESDRRAIALYRRSS